MSISIPLHFKKYLTYLEINKITYVKPQKYTGMTKSIHFILYGFFNAALKKGLLDFLATCASRGEGDLLYFLLICLFMLCCILTHSDATVSYFFL